MIKKPSCFQVQDATGHSISWFYFRHDDSAARHASVLTHDEARRTAVNFSRLPDLLTNPEQRLKPDSRAHDPSFVRRFDARYQTHEVSS
jgi:hypothetical protein